MKARGCGSPAEVRWRRGVSAVAVAVLGSASGMGPIPRLLCRGWATASATCALMCSAVACTLLPWLASRTRLAEASSLTWSRQGLGTAAHEGRRVSRCSEPTAGAVCWSVYHTKALVAESKSRMTRWAVAWDVHKTLRLWARLVQRTGQRLGEVGWPRMVDSAKCFLCCDSDLMAVRTRVLCCTGVGCGGWAGEVRSLWPRAPLLGHKAK